MNSSTNDLVISDEELSDIFLEVLRLYPPFIGSFRIADEDFVIGDHCVPGCSLVDVGRVCNRRGRVQLG